MNEKLDELLVELRNLTLDKYLLSLGLCLLASGFALFFYCIIAKVQIILITPIASPLFYLILGLIILFVRMFAKHVGLKECDIIGDS